MKGAKVAFLDRDGTINVDTGFVVLLQDLVFADRAVEALKILKDNGYLLAVVTNQSGIGRKRHTEDDVQVFHDHMQEQLRKDGVEIDVIVFCPHVEGDGCECRKPSRGMADQIESKLGLIDYENSWMIGDKMVDLRFGKTIGAHTALIHSKYWKEDDISDKPDVVADSLYEAVQDMVKL